MNTEINDDGYADVVCNIGGGMTLRDWFAGQALAGMATHLMPNEQVAANAVEIADIVIAKLKKGGSHE
jgi:hypothetical protein